MTAPLPSLTPQARAEIMAWVANADDVPESVRRALLTHEQLAEALAKGADELMHLLNSFRRAMGFEPSSERRREKNEGRPRARKPRKRKDAAQQLLEKKARIEARRRSHRANLRRAERELVAIDARIVQARAGSNSANSEANAEPTHRDEPTMTAEEEQRRIDEECDAQRRRSALQGEVDPTLQTAKEALMQGKTVTLGTELRKLEVAPEQLQGAKVLHDGTINRERYDFSLVVNRVELELEKKVIVTPSGERRTIYASTREVGPPRFSVTWGFLVHLTLMTTMYAIPMHRLGRMLTTDQRKFSASALSKMLAYVARHFVPIYIRLFDELSDATIMLGDDTNSRVLEANRHFANADDHEGASWSTWPARNAAVDSKKEPSKTLGPTLARELGFVFPYRKRKGNKISINTTVLAGRSIDDESKSFIVFYRTHFGSLGNLIEVALERRNPALAEVIIQCDLSTANLVADPSLRERFRIVIAGCLYHARRPFARYKHEDAEFCEIMLDCFAGLAFLEEDLDVQGRNQDNVRAVRQTDARAIWMTIKKAAKLMKTKWSSATKLGEAVNYILNHDKELEYYLDEPRLAPDNNLSERMVRMERIIENNSMFRVSFEGRCVLDVMRTVTQTAIAAEAPVERYLDAILRTPYSEIEEAPERFTPYAWMMRQSEREQAHQVQDD